MERLREILGERLKAIPATTMLGAALVLLGLVGLVVLRTPERAVVSDSPAPAVVVVAARPAAIDSSSAAAGGTAAAARAGPESRPPPSGVALVRELQLGLQRAGCYDGPISGSWTRSAQDAMSRFLAAVNASLPVDRPDQFLLATLQAHTISACSGAVSAVVAASRPLTPAPAPRADPVEVRPPAPPAPVTKPAPEPSAEQSDRSAMVTAAAAAAAVVAAGAMTATPREMPRFVPAPLTTEPADRARPPVIRPPRVRYQVVRSSRPRYRHVVRRQPRTAFASISRQMNRNLGVLRRVLPIRVY